MDMSVKLNVSYPVATATNSGTDKPAQTSPSGAHKVHALGADSDPQKLKSAVQEIQKFVQSMQRNLEFSIDQASGTVVVKVIASDSGEVVRQIPNEEALKLADSLNTASSVLFKGEA